MAGRDREARITASRELERVTERLKTAAWQMEVARQASWLNHQARRRPNNEREGGVAQAEK